MKEVYRQSQGFIRIDTSGINNWCGYFALANCLKYQPRYAKEIAYQNLKLETTEQINTYYHELLTEFNQFSTRNPNYQDELEEADQMPGSTEEEIIAKTLKISELYEIDQQFSTKTGFSIAEFKKLKTLKEELDKKSPPQNLLEELEKIQHDQENGKLYQFFIGGFLQKKYREEWKLIHQKIRFEQIFDQLQNYRDANQLAFDLYKLDENGGLFNESFINFEQIKFLAKQLNPLFKVVENTHESSSNNPISLECFSQEVAQFFIISDNKSQVILLLSNFLSASSEDIQTGHFTVDPSLNQDSFGQGIEEKFKKELKNIFYQMLAVEVYATEDYIVDNLVGLESKVDQALNSFDQSLKSQHQTIIDQAAAQLKAKKVNNNQDWLKIIHNIATNIDERLPRITNNKDAVLNKLKEEINKLTSAKEKLLSKNNQKAENIDLFAALRKAIKEKNVIELRIENRNGIHYTAMIPDDLYNQHGKIDEVIQKEKSSHQKAQEQATQLRDTLTKKAQNKRGETISRTDQEHKNGSDKDSPAATPPEKDGLVFSLYKQYYKTFFGEEFKSEKNDRAEKLKDLLEKFDNYQNFGDISGFALKAKDKDIRKIDGLAFKTNTMLHWAIANAENDIAEVLIDKINEKQFFNIYKVQALGNNSLHLLIAKGYINKDGDNNQVNPNNQALALKIIQNAPLETFLQKTTKQEGINDSELTVLDLAVLRGDKELVTKICEILSKLKEENKESEENQNKIIEVVENSKKYLNKDKSETLKLLSGNWLVFNKENITIPRKDIETKLEEVISKLKPPAPAPAPSLQATVATSLEEAGSLKEFLNQNENFKPNKDENATDYQKRINEIVKNQAKPKLYSGFGAEVDLIYETKDGAENKNTIIGFKITKIYDDSIAKKLEFEQGVEILLKDDKKITETEGKGFVINGKIVNEKLKDLVTSIRDFNVDSISIVKNIDFEKSKIKEDQSKTLTADSFKEVIEKTKKDSPENLFFNQEKVTFEQIKESPNKQTSRFP